MRKAFSEEGCELSNVAGPTPGEACSGGDTMPAMAHPVGRPELRQTTCQEKIFTSRMSWIQKI